jgi:hypothetical protein
MSDPAPDNMAGHGYHSSCVIEADRAYRVCASGVCCVRLTPRHAGLRDLHRHMIDYLAAIDYARFSVPVSLPLPQA